MDIHRARFIPYPSSAINALAFSANNDGELSKGGLKNLRLAVGRANGDIEIWNPLKGAWVQERIFHGGDGRSAEGLLWIQEPNEFDADGKISSVGQLRLFSIGYSSAVTEWDLATGLPLRQSSGNLNQIWCFAAQPRLHVSEARRADSEGKPRGQDIVVGCSDGSIALLSTSDNDLHFQKYIARPHGKNIHALSISFRDRHTIAVGFNNSTFRIYDIRSSTLIRSVSLGAGAKGFPKDLHVWAIRWLPNGDIACVDSAGDVRFFDAKLFTQYQRLNAHQGDIFSIAVSQDGSLLFTAGADRRTSIFRKTTAGRQWIKQGHKFYHDHDVKALAVYDGNKTQQMSFLASGGLDTNLSIVPVQNHGDEYYRGISGLPQRPPVASSETSRLVACWHGQQVDIWRMRSKENESKATNLHRPLAQIHMSGDETVASASISRDGQLIAVTTASLTRVFKLLQMGDVSKENLRVMKVETESPLPAGCIVQFSPDQKWLSIMSHSNDVMVFRLSGLAESIQVSSQPFRFDRIKRSTDSTSIRSHRQAISRVQFSPDSKVLAVTDLSGFINCWQLEGAEDSSAPEVEMKDVPDDDSDTSSSDDDDEEDDAKFRSFGQSWRRMDASRQLPQLDSAALVLSFRPGKRVKERQVNGTARKVVNGVNGVNGINGKHSLSPEAEAQHEEPLTEQTNDHYELFVLTANHQLHEFDLMTGKLTEWSRRNPNDCLPSAFQKIKDRAMGCYWHTTFDAQRLYLYGSNWLFMFDVSQDFVREIDREAENGAIARPQKRKRKGESGAGDKMRDEDYGGFRPEVEITQNGEPTKKRKKKQLPIQEGIAEDEDEEEHVASKSLRAREDDQAVVNDKGAGEGQSRKTWHSFAYRPIFAVIPLEETASYIETVIVERPMWELDLPPRLTGPYDKSR